MQQTAFSTGYDAVPAGEATGRAITAVVDDLDDQLTVICGVANLAAEAPYDAELTENYFTMIESAGKKAAQITRQLRELDPPWPSEDKQTNAVPRNEVQHAIDATTAPRHAPSTFRRRLTSARTSRERLRFLGRREN